jgi:hypothetical protein
MLHLFHGFSSFQIDGKEILALSGAERVAKGLFKNRRRYNYGLGMVYQQIQIGLET